MANQYGSFQISYWIILLFIIIKSGDCKSQIPKPSTLKYKRNIVFVGSGSTSSQVANLNASSSVISTGSITVSSTTIGGVATSSSVSNNITVPDYSLDIASSGSSALQYLYLIFLIFVLVIIAVIWRICIVKRRKVRKAEKRTIIRNAALRRDVERGASSSEGSQSRNHSFNSSSEQWGQQDMEEMLPPYPTHANIGLKIPAYDEVAGEGNSRQELAADSVKSQPGSISECSSYIKPCCIHERNREHDGVEFDEYQGQQQDEMNKDLQGHLQGHSQGAQSHPGNHSQGVQSHPGNHSQGLQSHPGNHLQGLQSHPGNDSQEAQIHPGNHSQGLQSHPGNHSQGLQSHPGNHSQGLHNYPSNDSQGLHNYPSNDSQGLHNHQGPHNHSYADNHLQKTPTSSTHQAYSQRGRFSFDQRENSYIFIDSGSDDQSIRNFTTPSSSSNSQIPGLSILKPPPVHRR